MDSRYTFTYATAIEYVHKYYIKQFSQYVELLRQKHQQNQFQSYVKCVDIQ